MKIGFDGQIFLKGDKTGIAWAAFYILHNMKITNDRYQINCFGRRRVLQQNADLHQLRKSGYLIKRGRLNDRVYRFLQFFVPLSYSLFFGKDCDVSFFFNYIIPPGVCGKKAVMVHDMAYRVYPETVRLKTRLLLKWELKRSCKKADCILTVSQFSKREIVRYLGIDEDKISVVPLGVDEKMFHANYSDDMLENVKLKYGLTEPYFLYLGTIEPRKNISRLMQAYAMMRQEKETCPALVIAGKKGWMYEEIFRFVHRLGLSSYVVFLGYVEQCDIPLLLKGAVALAYPSLYEGFGLPPLEAMACGTPVIVSDSSSLPEVVGEAGIYVNPLSVASIRDALAYLLDHKEKREELSRKGMMQAKKFRWQYTAKEIQKLITRLGE